MIGKLLRAIFSIELDVVIWPNRIEARERGGIRSSVVDAPFSCSHLMISDVDIFEEASRAAFVKLGLSAWFAFPRVFLTVKGGKFHPVEGRVVAELIKNAGASDVVLVDAESCDENDAERKEYVAEILRNR